MLSFSLSPLFAYSPDIALAGRSSERTVVTHFLGKEKARGALTLRTTSAAISPPNIYTHTHCILSD